MSVKFSLSELKCTVFKGDAKIHAFIASDILPRKKARKVSVSPFVFGKTEVEIKDIVLEIPSGASFAALVLQVSLAIPNYEGTPCMAHQGYAIVDLKHEPRSKLVPFYSVDIQKANDAASERGSAHVMCQIQWELSSKVSLQRNMPPFMSPKQLRAEHSKLLQTYMTTVQELETIENNVHETTRISTVFDNGRLNPSWLYWQTIEPSLITNSDIETWAQTSLLFLPGRHIVKLEDIELNSQAHADFLQTIVSLPVIASRYSDDVIAVESTEGQRRSDGLYIEEVDLYSMSTDDSCGDCEDRGRTIVAEIHPALCAYTGSNETLKVLLQPIKEYRPFAALVTQSRNYGRSAWAHYMVVMLHRSGFTNSSVYKHSQSVKLPTCMIIDTVYPSLTRDEAYELTHFVNPAERLKLMFNKSMFTSNNEWPTVIVRPPFVIDRKTMSQYICMRLYGSFENEADTLHSIVPKSKRQYGVLLSTLAHTNFEYKEVFCTQEEKRTILPELIWRHPPVHFQPAPPPTGIPTNDQQTHGVTIVVSPATFASKVQTLLQNDGEITWSGTWNTDIERDVPLHFFRWTPHNHQTL